MEYAKNILIGPPLRDTASEILGPEHQNYLDEFVQLFIAMHDEQVIQHTQSYPDVIQVLKQLHNKNIPMAVATNKRLAPTQKLMNHFGWDDYFQSIECSDSQSKMRNKDDMIQDIINHDESFYGCYFIGDTVNDGLSANLNQLPFIKACYGYGRDQEWSRVNILQEIHQFSEILKLI
jgi:phosphoglycolate phosphatase